ncbi:MAG TPA: hypothetical protein DEA51_02475 [Erysipelotrichaceae bacterium]|nr:hypothetical protein [Erysipelotrichaceae bacterium]
MNKADKIFIVIVAVLSIALYATVRLVVVAQTSNETIAVVTYRDKEVLRIDMSKNANYTVKGTLGDVFIEVKDKRIRVEKETSPYNICSIQGWVQYANVPITCLPNHVVIVIQNATNEFGEDTTVR